MKYFAIYDDDGTLKAFGGADASNVIGEITEAEYNALVQEQETLYSYADAVYNGEMAMETVPEKYRTRVEVIVAELEANASEDPADPEVDEALAILRGEVSE